MNVFRHLGVLAIMLSFGPAVASGDPHAAPAAKPHSPAAPAAATVAQPPSHASGAKLAHAPGAKPAGHEAAGVKKPELLEPSLRPLAPAAIHPPRQPIHPASPHAKPAHKKTVTHKAHAPVVRDESVDALNAGLALLGKSSGHGKAHADAAAVLLQCDDMARNRLLERNKRTFYVVQNAGNQLALGETALIYAVRQLHAPVLLITARPGCQAVNMARSDYSRMPAEQQRTLSALYVDKDISNQEAQLQNLDNQVEAAMMMFGGEIEAGRLAVIGAYYDPSGALGQGRGKLVVTNLNGEQERKEIGRLMARHALFNGATGMTAPLLPTIHGDSKPAGGH